MLNCMKLPKSVAEVVLSLFALLLVNKLDAQVFPMADDDSRWGYHIDYRYELFPGFYQKEINYYAVKLLGDSLINDSIFHKIYTKLYRSSASGPEANYDSSFVDNRFEHDGTYLYEDENGLYYSYGNRARLDLIWNYNWEAGDTIPENTLHRQFWDMKIDSVTLYIDGTSVPRKQWYVSLLGNEGTGIEFYDKWEPTSFISGIGSFDNNGGGFIFGFNLNEYPEWQFYKMDCYAYKGENLIRTCSDQVLSIHEQQELSLELYPNPVKNGLLHLNTDFRGSLKLYDLHGRELLQAQVQSGSQGVELSHLETGIYTLVLESDAGGQVVRRVQLEK